MVEAGRGAGDHCAVDMVGPDHVAPSLAWLAVPDGKKRSPRRFSAIPGGGLDVFFGLRRGPRCLRSYACAKPCPRVGRGNGAIAYAALLFEQHLVFQAFKPPAMQDAYPVGWEHGRIG